MTKLNKAILAMFVAGIVSSQVDATEKKKLEPFYKLNVLQYLPHVQAPENVRNDMENFEMVNSSCREAVNMSHINTFPIRNEADAELFPNLQTQMFFSGYDYIVPGVENVRFDSRMNPDDIYFIVQQLPNDVTQNFNINPCAIKNEDDANRFLRIINRQRVFSASDYIIPGVTQIELDSSINEREMDELCANIPAGVTFINKSNLTAIRTPQDAALWPNISLQNIFVGDTNYIVPGIKAVQLYRTVNMYDLFNVINGGSLFINGDGIAQCIFHDNAFRIRKDRNDPNSILSADVKFRRIEAYCKLHADGTTWMLRHLLGDYNDAYWNAGDYDFHNTQNIIIQATANSRYPITMNDFFVTLALADDVKDLNVITIPPVANKIIKSTTRGNLICGKVIFDHANSKLEELGGFEHSNITKIWIPNSVKKLNDFAFGDCDKLETVILPDELNEVDSNAFNGCKALKSLIVPNDTDVYYHHIGGSSVIILVKNGEIHKIAGFYPTDILLNQLKVYKKSDVVMNLDANGDFSVELKANAQNILRPFEVAENGMISIPDGIQSLDDSYDSNIGKGVRFMEMKNGTSLKLPSTLKRIKSNRAFRYDCIPSNIKTVFIPLQIREISLGTFYGDTVEKVIIYGNGSELEREEAAGIVRRAGFNGEIEFAYDEIGQSLDSGKTFKLAPKLKAINTNILSSIPSTTRLLLVPANIDMMIQNDVFNNLHLDAIIVYGGKERERESVRKLILSAGYVGHIDKVDHL